MTEIATSVKDSAGFDVLAKAIDMHKIGQAILYINERVDNHEDRITNLEKMLDLALKENKSLNEIWSDEVKLKSIETLRSL